MITLPPMSKTKMKILTIRCSMKQIMRLMNNRLRLMKEMNFQKTMLLPLFKYFNKKTIKLIIKLLSRWIKHIIRLLIILKTLTFNKKKYK